MRTSDLLVAGAGPVGLAVAIEAARVGMSVTVLDPRPGPIDKACGEGLMPPARRGLERLGVQVAGCPFHGIRYLRADAGSPADLAGAEARFRDGPGLGVRRTDLSGALHDRAAALGVRRLTGAAPTPRRRGDAVECGELRSRWFVAADGLHSPIRTALGLDGTGQGRTVRRFGLRRHYRIEPWADLVEVHWASRGEAYVTPVAEDLVGVAVLGPPGRGFDDWLGDFPALRRRLRGAEPADAVRGAGPLRQRVSARVVGARILLAGDAAGYVDALTGEGIAIGLAEARELIACLAAGRPDDYERAWRRVTRRYRVLTSGLLVVSGRPVLRRGLVPAARRLPWVFSAIVNQLG